MNRRTLTGRLIPPDQKRAVGRKLKQPPADAAEIIRQACEHGASRQGVAMALRCDLSVLTRWLDEHQALKQAFDEGKERERQMLHSVMLETAVNGEGRDKIIAAMFLLKSRHGYVEGEKEAQTNRVQINFAIPGAQPLEKFMVIDNEPDNQNERVSDAVVVRA